MGGKLSPLIGSYAMLFPFDLNHFAPTDVCSENAQLAMSLKTSISLETMKQALENKDKDLALA